MQEFQKNNGVFKLILGLPIFKILESQDILAMSKNANLCTLYIHVNKKLYLHTRAAKRFAYYITFVVRIFHYIICAHSRMYG